MQKHKDDNDFEKSAQWKSIVEETDQAKRLEMYRKVVPVLRAEDIAFLLFTLRTDDITKQVCALGLLLTCVREKNEVWKQHKEELVSVLRALVSKNFLADDPKNVGTRSFSLLQLIEPQAAAQILFEKDTTAMADEAYSEYIRNLTPIKSDDAIAMLRKLSETPGWRGKAAKEQLSRLGLMDTKDLNALGAKWKKSRSVKHLNDLYNSYVSRQLGKPLNSLFPILGPPSRQDGKNYWYDTKEKFALFLQEDGQGNIKAFKMLD